MADEFQTGNPDVQQAVTAALEEQKKKKKKKRLIIFGVILALIVVIGVAGSGSGDKKPASSAEDGTAAAGQTVSENTAGKDGKLGDYVCIAKSATKCTDWDGRESVKIVYDFTNNSKNPISFDTALEDKVFQDGIALETTFISGSDDQVWDVEIKPGITKEVTKVYVLRNSTSDLEIEVNEWLSFSDATYTATMKF